MGKFLVAATLAGFLMAATAHSQGMQRQSQPDQQTPQVQSVTGKVTQVETGGKAFSLEVNQGSDKHPMRFVVDKTTTVQGHVAAGTTASVDYQPDSNGQLVALSVKEQSQQQSQ
jgi:hypothetical protein